MRYVLCVTALLAVSACGEQRDARMHNQIDASEMTVSTYDVEVESVVLSGGGVGEGAWGSARGDLQFGASRETVESYLTAILGEAVGRSSNEECGAGPMETTDYFGPLTVNFQEGKLVGWFLQDDGTANPVRIAGGFGVENTVSDLRSGLKGFAMVEGSTLGSEFTSATGIADFWMIGA